MGASRHREGGGAGKEEGGGTKTLPLPVPADFQRANDIREGGESANFLEDVCPHIHIHVIRPSLRPPPLPFPLSVRPSLRPPIGSCYIRRSAKVTEGGCRKDVEGSFQSPRFRPSHLRHPDATGAAGGRTPKPPREPENRVRYRRRRSGPKTVLARGRLGNPQPPRRSLRGTAARGKSET